MRKCTCCTEANLALDGRNYHVELDNELVRDVEFLVGPSEKSETNVPEEPQDAEERAILKLIEQIQGRDKWFTYTDF